MEMSILIDTYISILKGIDMSILRYTDMSMSTIGYDLVVNWVRVGQTHWVRVAWVRLDQLPFLTYPSLELNK